MLLLLATAHAAEPDLTGVHVALGAGIEAALGSTGIAAEPVEGSVRLLVGPRWMLDLSASGGTYTGAYVATEQALVEEEVTETGTYEIHTDGWSASAGLRARFRVNPEGPVGLYLGVGAAYEHSESAGPRYEDVTDEETGETTLQEVGRSESEREEIAIDVSLAAVHWVSDRVSVSGGITVPFATWSTDTDIGVDTTGTAEVEERRILEGGYFGFWPRVGLSVHLRL